MTLVPLSDICRNDHGRHDVHAHTWEIAEVIPDPIALTARVRFHCAHCPVYGTITIPAPSGTGVRGIHEWAAALQEAKETYAWRSAA